MKKFILALILFCSFVVTQNAQAQLLGASVAFVNDTTTNTEVEYLVLASPKPLTFNYTVGVNVAPVNVSGTATVVAALQGSNNNSTWFDFGTSVTVNTAGTVGLYGWILADYPFKYIRVKLTSSGTGVTNFTGGLIVKRKT